MTAFERRMTDAYLEYAEAEIIRNADGSYYIDIAGDPDGIECASKEDLLNVVAEWWLAWID